MASDRKTAHLPGEEGIWLFVIGDMVMFTALFAIMLHYRSKNLEVFGAAHRLLDQRLGLVNTALMLSSSWCVATAVRSARTGRFAATRALLIAAALCGILFACIKYIEWAEKIKVGLNPTTNDFFMFYFALTGIHLVHVVIGTVVLIFLSKTRWAQGARGNTMRNLESGATFWHLVDLLWIVLFALLYLVP